MTIDERQDQAREDAVKYLQRAKEYRALAAEIADQYDLVLLDKDTNTVYLPSEYIEAEDQHEPGYWARIDSL